MGKMVLKFSKAVTVYLRNPLFEKLSRFKEKNHYSSLSQAAQSLIERGLDKINNEGEENGRPGSD